MKYITYMAGVAVIIIFNLAAGFSEEAMLFALIIATGIHNLLHTNA